MAAVHGPSIASHPSGKAHNIPQSRIGFRATPSAPTQPSAKPDPFYGNENIACLCAKFITHLFACPEYPPAPATHTHSHAKLPYFIAYALHRTKLHPSVNFAALVLLQRLKARFPTARGSSGHRLFISAFMIASKVMCDDTYSNKSWGIVAQGMFTLREINQMEREMCSYLEWELNVDTKTLKDFETMVRKDFVGSGPYPTYILHTSSKKSSSSSTPSFPPPNSSTSPIPSFGHGPRQPSPPPKPQPAIPTMSIPPTIMAPPPASAYSPPDTPESSRSTSTSPASSASPATPLGFEDLNVKIVSASSSPGLSIQYEKVPPVHPLKTKMFAFASPAVW